MIYTLGTKFFEIRDRGSMIPVMAIKIILNGKTQKEKWLLKCAGYYCKDELRPCIALIFLEINKCCFYSDEWGIPTMEISHSYIEENFDTLKSGDIIDVQFILGETKKPSKTAMGEFIRGKDGFSPGPW